MMLKQSYKPSYDSRNPLLTLKNNYKDEPTTYPTHLAVIKTNQQHTQHIWQHRPFYFVFFFNHSYTHLDDAGDDAGGDWIFHRSKDSGYVLHGDVDPCHGGPAGWMNWWRLVTQQKGLYVIPKNQGVLSWRNDLEVSDMCSKDHVKVLCVLVRFFEMLCNWSNKLKE